MVTIIYTKSVVTVSLHDIELTASLRQKKLTVNFQYAPWVVAMYFLSGFRGGVGHPGFLIRPALNDGAHNTACCLGAAAVGNRS